MLQAPKLKAPEQKKISSYRTKSAQIKYLFAHGYTNGEISRILSKYHGKLVRPQHVSGVLRTPVKNPTEK